MNSLPLQPAQDLVGDALGPHDLALQLLGEELVAVAAAAFGPVKRDVGVDQQLLGVDAAVGGNADADAEPAGWPR